MRSLDFALFCCKARNKWETRNVIDSFFPLIECSNRYLNDLQQNRAQSRRLYLFHYKTSFKFPSHYFQFFKEILFPGEQRYRQYALYFDRARSFNRSFSERYIRSYYIKKKTVQVKSDFACLSYSFYTGSLAVRKKVIDLTLTEYQSGWRRSDRYVDGLTMGDGELTTCVGELTWLSVTKCTRSIFFLAGCQIYRTLRIRVSVHFIFIFGNRVLIVAYFIYFRSHWKCYHITASVLSGS